MDNAFSRLDDEKRLELLNYIKNYAKENNITVVYTTNIVKDLSLSDRILLIKNNTISFDGTYDELLKLDLNKEGIGFPFEIEVSNKLSMYDLINKDHLDMDDLVEDLCN